MTVSYLFDVLGDLENSVESYDTFKHENLEVANGCIERCLSQGDFASAETLESIEKSRAARLAGNQDQ